MRILVLSDLYPPYYRGGHELRCKINAEEFRKRGHDIFVLTSNYGVKYNNTEEGVYRKLHFRQKTIKRDNNLIARTFRKFKQFSKNFLNYFITQELVANIRPDIVYAGQLSGVSLFPIRAIEKLGIPIVHHIGNYYQVDLIKNISLEKNFFKRAFHKCLQGFSDINKMDFKNVIAVSRFLKNQYVDSGLPESNIRVIPPRGIPPEVFIAAEDVIQGAISPFKMLFVGRVVKEKGLETLIRALDYLVKIKNITSIKLDIVGGCDASYQEQIKLLVEQLGLSENTFFRGDLSHEQVLKEYPQHHVLAVPSVWEEPFGMVVLEGMASGIPVVASRVGGIVEIIDDGKDGLLVPPGDPVELGEAILRLIHEPSITQRFRTEAIRKVKAEYSRDIIVERLLECLEQVKISSVALRGE